MISWPGEGPLIEFRPAMFARRNEVVTGSDGRRWIFLDERIGWHSAPMSVDGQLNQNREAPPELRLIPIVETTRKKARGFLI